MTSDTMATTRRPSQLDVFQDSDASFSARTDAEVETALLNALRPLGDASHKQNVQLNPTTGSQSGSSPTKTDSSPPRPLSSRGLRDVKLPPPSQPVFQTDSPRKNARFCPLYPPPTLLTEKSLFTQFATAQSFDKENYEATGFTPMPPLPYSGDIDYVYQAPAKRPLMDTVPHLDRPNVKKQKLERDDPFELPDPSDMPPVYDNGQKPTHSYAELIGMAILRAPNRRLTLAQIYKWITDNFSFYRTAESGWQNSIRHNLSLNKNFVKQERPKDDPGKGNYWAIKAGEERPFLIGKKNPMRRSFINSSDGLQNDLAGFRPGAAPAIGQFTLAPNPVRRVEMKHIDSAKFPDDGDFSSDGTIPASDVDIPEDEKDDAAVMPPPSSHFRSSPPPQEIGSSPPAMATQTLRGDTPPPVPTFPSMSRSRGSRQKFAAVNDSGYWSSIESSAARGAAHVLTSEADIGHPRIKKGRAEAEIARMRSSSFDSPTKDRLRTQRRGSELALSSPLKDDNPLTPAVVFKRPARPPPSISPNTNLRNHRNRMKALLGSPAKVLSPLPETSTWSPAFNLVEDSHVGLTPFRSPFVQSKTPWKPNSDTPGGSMLKKAFDIFIDAPEEDLTARGSPEKRSVRRPSLARAVTSTGILADITGNAKNNNLTLASPGNSPFSLSQFLAKPGPLRSPANLGSPLKQCHEPPTADLSAGELDWPYEAACGENLLPSAVVSNASAAAELFGVHLSSDGSEEGIDIFQDFGKIGQAPAAVNVMPDRANGSPMKRTAMGPPARPVRPGMMRSNTSRW
ncbi:hypothetical protein BAUCODRAFT_451965 [Baudoinia panamericana UAMH 10762]|uniref:Fork-head domain-containing protein n=1 Tax=Baudoinia panamericana (strain UAMH 10762) TaxID=717646 RepID=M2ML84_BAUPA|nr:uncharacterized protein BAUCODRAFT_451965 [Baudoinia panamericana UAMH 10762]EMC97436.1 hypothetical protein BAUCODRAFT_451965 [Baudoinia panamericana UAMH 10762]